MGSDQGKVVKGLRRGRYNTFLVDLEDVPMSVVVADNGIFLAEGCGSNRFSRWFLPIADAVGVRVERTDDNIAQLVLYYSDLGDAKASQYRKTLGTAEPFPEDGVSRHSLGVVPESILPTAAEWAKGANQLLANSDMLAVHK